MSGVFFWTGLRSKNKVGTTSRYGAPPVHPVANPNLIVYTDLSAPMDSYIATKDPARLPTSLTYVQGSMTNPRSNPAAGMGLTNQANRAFPCWPYYGYWGTAASYLEDCIAAGYPANYNDTAVTGPYFYTIYNRPVFFYSYILQGTTSITGSNFFAGNIDPVSIWQVSRRSQSPVGRSGPLYEIVSYVGIAPVCAYILRPSTQAVIGFVYQRQMDNFKGPASYTDTDACTAPLSYGSNNTGPWSKRICYANFSGLNDTGFGYTVNGIQDGDLLVWEMWLQATFPNIVETGLSTFSHRVDFQVGGGTNNVTWTRDGQNMPNWSPGWGYQGTINGVETPLASGAAAYQVSVGF